MVTLTEVVSLLLPLCHLLGSPWNFLYGQTKILKMIMLGFMLLILNKDLTKTSNSRHVTVSIASLKRVPKAPEPHDQVQL